jgi:hypothetical protein
MPTKSKFRAPTFAPFKKDRSYVQLAAEAEQAVAAIYADPNLSETGKAKAVAKALAPAYKTLRGVQNALRKRAPELEAEMEKLTGRAFSITMDAFHREQTMELAREMRRDPALRQRVLNRLIDERDQAPNTVELRKFFVHLDPMLSGLTDATVNLMRLRLQPSLPQEAQQIENKMAVLREELRDTALVMEAIQQSVHREDFEELGVVGKPMSEWTPEERAEYLAKHGQDAFGADLYADLQFSRGLRGDAPEGQQPEGHREALDAEEREGRQRVNANLHTSSLFAPIEAAAA